MKPGEKLVRQLIAELDEKIKDVQRAQASGYLTPRLVRYRMRWLREDYSKLERVAKRWGFRVKE